PLGAAAGEVAEDGARALLVVHGVDLVGEGVVEGPLEVEDVVEHLGVGAPAAGLAGAEVGAEGGRAAGAVDRLVELGEVRAQAGHQGVYLLLRGAVLEPLDGVVVGLEEPVVLLDEREEPLDGLLAGDVAAGAALVEEGSEDGEHGGRGRRDGRKVAPRAGPPREKAATRACSPAPRQSPRPRAAARGASRP